MNNLLYNKLATIYFLLFTINSLSVAFVTIFLNSEWYNKYWQMRLALDIGMILQVWTGTMLAFVNKAANRVAKDEPPLPTDTGNTAIITKEQTNEKTTT